jgi:hypothetical protein
MSFKLEINDIFDELKDENNRLLTELINAQKFSLLKRYRNYLINLTISVNVIQILIKINLFSFFRSLENDYKLFINNKFEDNIDIRVEENLKNNSLLDENGFDLNKNKTIINKIDNNINIELNNEQKVKNKRIDSRLYTKNKLNENRNKRIGHKVIEKFANKHNNDFTLNNIENEVFDESTHEEIDDNNSDNDFELKNNSNSKLNDRKKVNEVFDKKLTIDKLSERVKQNDIYTEVDFENKFIKTFVCLLF